MRTLYREFISSINVTIFSRRISSRRTMFLPFSGKSMRARQNACGCSRFLSHRQSYRRGGSKSRRERIDTYTKRDSVREAGGSRRPCKEENRKHDHGISYNSRSRVLLLPLCFAAFRSREQRKASNESEKELFYSVKYRRRDRAAAFFLATEEASGKRGECTTTELRFRQVRR